MPTPLWHSTCSSYHWTNRELFFCQENGPAPDAARVAAAVTDRQLWYIEKLKGDLTYAAKLTKSEASDYITRLKKNERTPVGNTKAAPVTSTPEWEPKFPFKTPRPMIEAMKNGRYAVRANDTEPFIFVRVSRPTHGKRKGSLIIQSQHSDWYRNELVIYPNGKFWVRHGGTYLDHSLLLVAADPVTGAINYGRELGCCSRCGRELTDERSRYYSIGPECEKHWPELINRVNEDQGEFRG